MLKFTVSRDDSIYECFPDIAMAKDGTLICVYTESMSHSHFPFTRLVCRRSTDGGRQWLPKQIIDECVASEKQFKDYISHNPGLGLKDKNWMLKWDDAMRGYEESKSRITEAWKIGALVGGGRILCLSDGQLLLAAVYGISTEATDGCKDAIMFYRSFDAGITWTGPEKSGLHGGPSLNELRDGRILLGLCQQIGRPPSVHEFQQVFFSSDKGKNWSDPVEIPQEAGQDLNEGSFVELNDDTILGILRDDKLGRGYKVLSPDGGHTWTTQLIALEGRPKAGLLRSGEICITYRMDVPNEMLALHLMTQEAALVEGISPLIPRQPSQEYSMDPNAEGWHLKSYYAGRTVVLDMDRSLHRDSGYSGWVELDSGDIYVVDYINDDAPLAHIRGYLVNRSDIILFPDGDLPWLHPGAQLPFVQMSFGMAARQYMKNRKDTGR